jgi:hypothetical protein
VFFVPQTTLFKKNKMILKTKIATSYYVAFLVVLPVVFILFALIYIQYIPLWLGMIIVVFSLPFLFLPFVFEYYTFDGTDLKVKNILGITTKKIAFSDYEDIYGLDKMHGKYVLASTSFYIVDKKERVISLKSYYCQNLEAFIIKLSKGKTLREDREQLHSLKMELKKDFIYFILLSGLTLLLTITFCREIITWIILEHDFQWLYIFVVGFLCWLVYQSGSLLKTDYKDYKLARQKVANRTLRLSKLDKRFK